MFHSQNEKRKQTLYQKKNEISFLIMLFLLSLQKKTIFWQDIQQNDFTSLIYIYKFCAFFTKPKTNLFFLF